MSRSITVTVSVTDPNDLELEVKAKVTFATKDYFDKSFGNWLPGDPDEVEILDVIAVDEGADVAWAEGLPDRVWDRAVDHAWDVRHEQHYDRDRREDD